MKKINMKTTAAGPLGNFEAGRDYTVADELADTFIEAGAADLVEVVDESADGEPGATADEDAEPDADGDEGSATPTEDEEPDSGEQRRSIPS